MENKISDESRKLVIGLLEINYKYRLSANEALIKIKEESQIN